MEKPEHLEQIGTLNEVQVAILFELDRLIHHATIETEAKKESQSTRSLSATLLHVPGFGQRRVPAYVERLVFIIQNHGFNRIQRHGRLSKERETFKRNMSVGVYQHCSVLFMLLKGSFRHREGIQVRLNNLFNTSNHPI
jgi:hypothetical protein